MERRSVRPSAEELGIHLEFDYAFVGMGESTSPVPGCLFLDVGNRLDAGVIDQHHDGELAESTAQLVCHHKELVWEPFLGDLARRRSQGEDIQGTTVRIRIITHSAPDWDGVVATFFAQHLLRYGELPTYAEVLANYSARVDQGSMTLPRELVDAGVDADGYPLWLRYPHLAMLAISHLQGEEAIALGLLGNTERLRLGLALVDRAVMVAGTMSDPANAFDTVVCTRSGQWVAAPREAKSQRPYREAWWSAVEGERDADPSAEKWLRLAEFLVADRERWKEEARPLTRAVLPRIDGSAQESVPAMILDRCSRSALNKYWARSDGAILFLCPYADRNDPHDGGRLDGDDVVPRYVISVPGREEWPSDVPRVDLRGLGHALEQAETQKRRTLRLPERGGRPRWGDQAYSDNGDPWYDGRGHRYTIVDAPRAGTMLTYAQVRQVVLGNDTATTWAPTDVVAERVIAEVLLFGLEQPSRRYEPAGGRGPQRSRFGPSLAKWLSALRTRRLTHEDIAQLGLFGIGLSSQPDDSGYDAFSYVLDDAQSDPLGVAVSRIKLRGSRVGLGQLTAALRAIGSKGGQRVGFGTYVVLAYEPAPFFGNPGVHERLMADLLGQPDLDVFDDGRPTIGRAATVMRFGGATAAFCSDDRLAEDVGALSDAAHYAGFLDATLKRTSVAIGDHTDGIGSASSLRRAFLRFQSLYYQIRVTHDARFQGHLDALLTHLSVPVQYEEALREIEALVEVEEANNSVIQERLLSLVGSLGLLQVVDILVGAFTDPESQSRWHIDLACLVVTVFVWLFLDVARRRR